MNQNDQNFLVQKIRTQYTEKEYTSLDALKALDKKVTRPANVFACVFGSISALIMGSGMSLVMTDLSTILGLENPMLWGILIGCLGLLMAIVNYPMYRRILTSRRKRYAEEVVSLSDRILNG